MPTSGAGASFVATAHENPFTFLISVGTVRFGMRSALAARGTRVGATGKRVRLNRGYSVFEYRKGNSPGEVAALFGDGVELINASYVEDSNTGDLLANAGSLGRAGDGRIYLLRWRGRTLGLHSRMTLQEGKHGTYPVFTLSDLGTSKWARIRTHVASVELAPAEAAAAAMRVAAEACVVLEATRADHGPGARVSDPDGSGRELSPVEFGYPEIIRAPWGVR